jgi:glyoxalase family protein
LHHVTAVTGDGQRNVDFYRNVLGQRLVKRTVNFDGPDTYHFYFGDEIGSPGGILTFFAWSHVRRGVRGNGETSAVAYHVLRGSLGFWGDHLQRNGILPQPVEKRFGEDVLRFDDPDGMRVELVESASAASVRFWQAGPVPQSFALQGFHSVTLWLEKVGPTAELLTGNMGYSAAGSEGDRHRFVGDLHASGHIVDIVERPGKTVGGFGKGSIHHIAFRAPDDEQQLEYQTLLRTAGFDVTPVRDRNYFHSIYYRERGGVLFEIATDPPGFAIDEPVDALGETLKLPAWLEPNRGEIERDLPPLELKEIEKVG